MQLYAVMGSEAPLSQGQQLQPKQECEARRSHLSLAPYGAPAGDSIHRQGWVQNGTPTQRSHEQSLDLPL